MADRTRAQIKEGYATFPDYHLLRDVVQRNRQKWAGYPHPHPIKEEQLMVADVAAEILAERTERAEAGSTSPARERS